MSEAFGAEAMWSAAVKKKAYELDSECWLSYSGRPKAWKRAWDRRRTAALESAKLLVEKANVAGYPDDNPKTLVGATKIPLDLVPPSVVHALARAFADGAKKYGAYNWREKKISATTYYGALLRHVTAWWDGEDVAQDSGHDHLDHAIACLAMLIDAKSIGKLNDNRPPKGAAAQMQADYLKSKE